MVYTNLDVGAALPYFFEKFQGLFGKDPLTEEKKRWMEQIIKISLKEASFVQCIGMAQPVPIGDIYQPTKLEIMSGRRDTERGKYVNFEQIIDEHKNAIIFGGPGDGKTVLLHWIYYHLFSNEDYIPMLFTLRWPTGVADLLRFTAEINPRKLFGSKKQKTIVLLVDGYDEISRDDQRKVSAALRVFDSSGMGVFYLTCRMFYEVYDVIGVRYQIVKFSPLDTESYIKAFSKAYGVRINANHLVKELNLHSFSSFLTHPLLLAMICILRSGPMPLLPRTTVGLIRRAIDTLTLRWDESKGISREPTSGIPIDGDDRVRCLMILAFNCPRPSIREDEVIQILNKQMKLVHHTGIDAGKLVLELAQWYGIFIPTSDSHWGFVHNTMRDYLSARYLVESGRFLPNTVTNWDARAAYAACLMPDATQSIILALKVNKNDLYAFTECIYNNAPFDTDLVAKAVIQHFDERVSSYTCSVERDLITAETNEAKADFFDILNDEMLNSLLAVGISGQTRKENSSAIFIICFSCAELFKRGKRLTPAISNQLRRALGTTSTKFDIKRLKSRMQFSITDLENKPILH